MEQRIEPRGFDDFPTPVWAVRAFLKHAFHDPDLKNATALDPACGRGHMVRALAEVFPTVVGTDICDYGFGFGVRDFLREPYDLASVDWLITNPPFVLGDEFVREGLRVARRGVAILARASFAEGRKRYRTLFKPFPPALIATYAERVPIVKGRVDPEAVTASVYGWFVWRTGSNHCRHIWIPPCRKELEKEGDYEPGFPHPAAKPARRHHG